MPVETLNAITRNELLAIVLFYALAWFVSRFSRRMAGRVARMRRLHPYARPQRLDTLEELIASLISLVAFVAATIASLAQFVSADTLVWGIGLFSAAFGLSARPIISDFMAGISFLFEDTFAVGEKVEVVGIEGVIEQVNVRTTWIRGRLGEQYIVPNGEIRIVRNFSRGQFSNASVRVRIPSEHLEEAITVLETAAEEAFQALPSLLEPWRVIAEETTLGETAELLVLAKAEYGHGAEVRPRLMAFIQRKLAAAGVPLKG
ncbi:MAG: hypothetical protein D6802_03915 [Ardenticatenia bacterium]|nr:MAG: hypothetical protein D6802_03915 [Ardenticatenia bacterium]